MKKNKYLYFHALIALIFISCQSDDKPITEFDLIDFGSNMPTQIFNVGLVKDTLILGKNNTKIYFDRGSFNLSATDSITILLKELYDFDSILLNGISTITNKNELLETSGVFFLEIKAGNKRAELKQNENIEVTLPIKNLSVNNIFKAKIDSLGRYQWIEENVKVIVTYPDTLKNRAYGLSSGYIIEKTVPIDSVGFYENITNNWNNSKDDILETNSLPALKLESFGWYNIDKYIYEISRIDFKVNISNSKSDAVATYLIYDDIKSVIFNYHNGKTINYDSVPYRNDLNLIIVDRKDSLYYFSKIRLDSNKKTYQTELTATTLDNLRNVLRE